MLRLFLIILLMFLGLITKSQNTGEDSTFRKRFEKENCAEIYPGIFRSKFDFTTSRILRSGLSLEANASAYMGFFFNYKWATLKYARAFPGTSLNNNIKFRYHMLEWRYNGDNFSLHPFYNSFNGLLFKKGKGLSGRKNDPVNDVSFKNAGLDFLYFLNRRAFSFRASYLFAKQQLKSAGSFFLTANPRWQSIKWKQSIKNIIKDSSLSRFVSFNPHWISLSAGGGYSYIFSFRGGRWLVAPATDVGAGVLKRLDYGRFELKPVFGMEGWINAGYNGSEFYTYFNADWRFTHASLPFRNVNTINDDFSITFGLRFGNSRRKIFGII